MSLRGSKGRRSGFTLIEVLLAVAVFSVVLLAINGVFFGALRLRNKSAEVFERSLPIQQTVALIRKDLQGLAAPGGTLSGQLQTLQTSGASLMDTLGKRATPDLYTASGLVDEWSPFSEMQKVAYFLANPTNNSPGFDLVRGVSRNLLPSSVAEIESQYLMSGVESMTTLFYDGSTWTESWDSTVSSNLPTAIRVQIALVDAEGRSTRAAPIEVVVPVWVQMATNAVAATGTTP